MEPTHEQLSAEIELITAVAKGDSQAFEYLYRQYETRVYQYVLTLGGDKTLAEEIVVEVMVAVWQGAASFARRSRVSTWILGIARHKAMDAFRRMRRRPQDVGLDQASDLPNPGAGPAEMAERKNVDTLMQQALAKLSLEHQQALRLAFYEELPYEEIAALLDIPVNTVKTRVFYAKQQLKRNLVGVLDCEPLR